MPNTESVKFGGYLPPFPLKTGGAHLDDVEKVLRRPVELFLWYQWWGAGWGVGRAAKDFQPKWLTEAGDRDVLIKWEPWKPGRRILQPEFGVGTIVRGAHDAYLGHRARRIRDYGRPVYLCPMAEPNGFWNQWSMVLGKHPPGDYIAAWRHMHAIFEQEGAANVRWVRNPNAGDMPAENRMEAYYPGGDCVDILGLSVYNWGTARP